MTAHSTVASRCREIADADLGSIAVLLSNGFPNRSRAYWLGALDRLKKHSAPADMPKYGYLVERAGAPVGAILLISTMMPDGNASTTRCSLSSWFLEPRVRVYAPLLSSQAIKKKNVTYYNLTPAAHTLPILEAQGYSRFSNGQFVASIFPFIRRGAQPVRVIERPVDPDAHFEPFERDLLSTHSEWGCISLWCVSSGSAYPFVFVPRFIRGVIPCVQLLYCRQIEDFVRFAPQIGSYLGWRGRPFVLIDSKGPIPGLPGKYFDGIAPKYYKGPVSPRLGDLAYTELAMLPRLLGHALPP
jgi:hypothetical protein